MYEITDFALCLQILYNRVFYKAIRNMNGSQSNSMLVLKQLFSSISFTTFLEGSIHC